MGVIVSLTLDDGEEERPHRQNMFKTDFKKVGIACGPHSMDFQMCVMDFAYDFVPLKNINKINTNFNINNKDVINNINMVSLINYSVIINIECKYY